MFKKHFNIFWYRKRNEFWPDCIQEYLDTKNDYQEVVFIRCPPKRGYDSEAVEAFYKMFNI